MLGNFATGGLGAIAVLATAAIISTGERASLLASPPHEAALPPPVSLAQASHRPIQLIDRVEAGSDFDEFRDRLWQAIQQRDKAFVSELLPAEGIFIGEAGPIPPEMLDIEDTNSSFWQTLEKMLAPQSCELDDYPGTLPDSAVWACPNIASAMIPPSAEASETTVTTIPEQVAVVGRGVNVRARPQLGTSVVGRLSNEVVELDRTTWRELVQSAPETADNPIEGWTPVILPNQIHGYVYNRYVYHAQGPRALFELIDGQWQLLRIVIDEDTSLG